MTLISRNNVFDIDRFFNDSWPQLVEPQAGTFFAPRVDIKEAGDHYEITAELPGVDKKDIHVHVKDGVLTLEAETSKEEKDVQESDIKASFKDGVLTLEAPKIVEKVQERRRIEVD